MSGKHPLLTLAVVTLAAIAVPAGHRSDGGLQAAVTPPEALAAAMVANQAEGPAAAPVRFEENGGQFLPHVRFVTRGPGYELALSGHAMEMLVGHDPRLGRSLIGLHLIGAAPSPVLMPEAPLDSAPGGGNPGHARVRHLEAYEGIDLVVHGRHDAPRYELHLAHGTDPDRIRMRVSGAELVEIDDHGNLVLASAHGTVVHRRPQAWQVRDGERVPVAVQFVLDAGNGDVGFLLGAFDPMQALAIDPIVVIATPGSGNGDEPSTAQLAAATFDLATRPQDAEAAGMVPAELAPH